MGMEIRAGAELPFRDLNAAIRDSAEREIRIRECIGQRYIGAGLSDREIRIEGTPGNALGAYLNGARIRVSGNAQDATGDTMNGGEIVIEGNSGDATGYAMRGGRIFVRGDAGYRTGIHMKAYKENHPAIVIGGVCGSFLGEYQAGGTIVVLGEGAGARPVVGNFCGTGMHGGEMYIRADELPKRLAPEVKAERLDGLASGEAQELVAAFCERFGRSAEDYVKGTWWHLTPNSENPYKQMYVNN